MPPSSQQAYASLQDFSKNRRSTQDIQKEAENKYNVSGISSRLSGLRTMVGNLENSLENVDPSVRGRNSGGFTTEAQNQALVNREQQPILGNLSKQQRAYGDTQQEFSLSSSLAGELARSIRSDDETSYQRLLDQYNASTAQEQAAEAKRQFEENARLERDKLAASQKSAAGYDIGGILKNLGYGDSAGAAPAKPDDKQRAQSAVSSLLSTKNDSLIRKTFDAIKKSAGFGNAYDKLKLQLLLSTRPDLNVTSQPGLKLLNGSGLSVLGGSNSALRSLGL